MERFDYNQFGGLIRTGHDEDSYRKMVENGVHRLTYEGIKIDFLCQDMESAKERGVILVCFGGALKAGHNLVGPYFSGISVGKRLKLPLISISDPTLEECPSLLLSWYMGSPEKPQLPRVIAKHLDNVAAEFDARLVLFGGSGGGFGILNSQQHISSRADSVIWNPQTFIPNYIPRVVTAYANEACGYKGVLDGPENARNFLEATGLDFDVTAVKMSNGNVLYLQNADDNHVQRHMQPFLAAGIWEEVSPGLFRCKDRGITVVTGLWGVRHAVVPKGTLLMALQAVVDGISHCEIARDVQAAHPLSSVPS